MISIPHLVDKTIKDVNHEKASIFLFFLSTYPHP